MPQTVDVTSTVDAGPEPTRIVRVSVPAAGMGTGRTWLSGDRRIELGRYSSGAFRGGENRPCGGSPPDVEMITADRHRVDLESRVKGQAVVEPGAERT